MSGFGGGVASLSMKTAGAGGGIVTNNLVLHLDAGNSSSYSGSGTTWTDLSGQNNNGTLVGGTGYSSDDGGYLIFDGTDDKVFMSAGSDFAYGTGDFTVEVWCNVTGTSPPVYGAKLFTQTVGGQNYFKLGTSDGNPVVKQFFFKYGTGGGTRVRSGFEYTVGKWHHFVVTRNGSTLTQYVDGDLKQTTTGVSFNFTNTTYNPTIGGFTHGTGNIFDGKIAQVRVYKGKGFSAADVQQNFDATKSRYTGIVTNNLVLHLDAGNSSSYSGSGTTWSDLSGSSNDGTLTNGVTYSSDNGGVLVFDGTDDYVVTGSDMFNANADFTFSMWFNSDDFSVQRAFVADVDNSQSLFLRYNNGIQLVNSNTAILGYFSSSTLSTNTWYNITLTRSSNTYTLYVNGSSVSTVNSSQGFNHSPTTIGANDNNSPPPTYKNAFDGKIAQVLAYSTALSDSDVQRNFDATKGRYGL